MQVTTGINSRLYWLFLMNLSYFFFQNRPNFVFSTINNACNSKYCIYIQHIICSIVRSGYSSINSFIRESIFWFITKSQFNIFNWLGKKLIFSNFIFQFRSQFYSQIIVANWKFWTVDVNPQGGWEIQLFFFLCTIIMIP